MSDLDPEKFRNIDEMEDNPDARFHNAVNVLISNLAPDLEDRRMGPNEQAAHAVNTITEIAAENERLKERVGKLEAELNPNPDSKPYKELGRDEKVQKLREYLVSMASSRHSGKFAMEYNDVVALFDGQPSPGHAYDLMEIAGNADGFAFKEFDDRTNQLRVNLDDVNDETLFHAANNGVSEVEG
ncbi:hypothetical protein [Natrinema soli]|uniref:Uncharacterized protein n=1 Tax=Natrinema soli TaxID=1930624 RepID=A0ABD5SJR7_9EURY|nr:hypothetical protein [Natrinema soli]